ncbi:metallophosphoesterase family protein [Rufibacter latericius]|uniref:Metallophosphoesterase n=1 Tax=Rufibacter latericius TaxID=2487040 RepID=A0A3M9MTC0_9BACT|nr:metallophosphoesterase [Rufibacter latericius]RNI28751.1 metallophosphoesterase [Rufibacter latericius]
MKTKNLPPHRTWLALSLLFLLSACDMFQYHPYAGNLEYKDLTAENLSRIKALEPQYDSEKPLKFALTGDTQGYFEETEDMVKDMNSRDIAFVLHAGDLTNYAFTDEYERMHEVLVKLKMPYVTVIGNHDCLGDGDKLYKEMYGPLNYSFTFGRNKFILLNTNFLEFDESVPDINWLERELQTPANIENKFVISHIIPDNSEANRAQEQAYVSLMHKYDVRLSLHGHTHNYSAKELYQDGIPYVTTAATLKRSYVMVTVAGNQATYEKIDF